MITACTPSQVREEKTCVHEMATPGDNDIVSQGIKQHKTGSHWKSLQSQHLEELLNICYLAFCLTLKGQTKAEVFPMTYH